MIEDVRQKKLEGLYLRRFNIESLPPPMFHDLPHITEVNLSWNNLSSIPPSLLTLPNLQKLILRGNQLKKLPAVTAASPSAPSSSSDQPLSPLPFLEFLDIAENLLVSLPDWLSDLFPGLKVLIVDVNNLTSFPLPLPPPAFQLTTLSASNNQLTEFPVSFLATSLPSLTVLNFSDNKLTDLSNFPAFPDLETVQLGHNELTSIPTSLFGCSKLTTLTFFRNRLTSLPTSITSLSSLARLDLSFNQLSSIPEEQILTMTSLDHLDLRGNDLDRLSLSDNLLNAFGERILIEGDVPDEIYPGLWLGSYNAAKNRFWLNRHNITHILTVASGLDDVPRAVCWGGNLLLFNYSEKLTFFSLSPPFSLSLSQVFSNENN